MTKSQEMSFNSCLNTKRKKSAKLDTHIPELVIFCGSEPTFWK